MYVSRNSEARSRNVYASSLILTTLSFHSKRTFLWRFHVAGNNLGFYVRCPIQLTDFNQIRSFSIDFHKSSQYQTSRKSVQ
jgi:hypothetical protein